MEKSWLIPTTEGNMWEQLLHHVGGDSTIDRRDSKEFRDCEFAVCSIDWKQWSHLTASRRVNRVLFTLDDQFHLMAWSSNREIT
jgi:hypothetical protein